MTGKFNLNFGEMKGSAAIFNYKYEIPEQATQSFISP